MSVCPSSPPRLRLVPKPEKKPRFVRYIGIDYSGAEVPLSPLKGLRAYIADGDDPPREATTTEPGRKYWCRQALTDWLIERLGEDLPTLVGMDHGFSFPLAYFEKYGLAYDWPAFLDDFAAHQMHFHQPLHIVFVVHAVPASVRVHRHDRPQVARELAVGAGQQYAARFFDAVVLQQVAA